MAIKSCFAGQSHLLLCPLLRLANLHLSVLDWRTPNWTQCTPGGVSTQNPEKGSLLANSPGGTWHCSHEDTLLSSVQPVVTKRLWSRAGRWDGSRGKPHSVPCPVPTAGHCQTTAGPCDSESPSGWALLGLFPSHGTLSTGECFVSGGRGKH